MTGRCATCRWWQDGQLPRNYVGWVRPAGWNQCTHEGTDDARFAVDGLDADSELITAPDFGCVQWEPTE